MLIVETPQELGAYAGKKLGVSEWIAIDQSMIDRFAEITGDTNWFHIDVERAGREMPGGKTIAHGCLTLSLLARMSATIYRINQKKRGLFYGANKVRFTSPVSSGSRIRLHETLKEARPVDGGMRFTSECMVEIEGAQRRAMFAEMIIMAFA